MAWELESHFTSFFINFDQRNKFRLHIPLTICMKIVLSGTKLLGFGKLRGSPLGGCVKGMSWITACELVNTSLEKVSIACKIKNNILG